MPTEQETRQEILKSWNFGNTPRVLIEPGTWCDILNAAQISPIEFSWFSKVETLPERVCRVSGMIIPPQTCSKVHTDVLKDAFYWLGSYLDSVGEKRSLYSCWGHSHVDAEAYMSSKDWYAIQQRLGRLLLGSPPPAVGPLVSIVVNRYAKARCWVSFARPACEWSNITPELDPAISEDELRRLMLGRRAAIEAVLRERVRYDPLPLPEEEKP